MAMHVPLRRRRPPDATPRDAEVLPLNEVDKKAPLSYPL